MSEEVQCDNQHSFLMSNQASPRPQLSTGIALAIAGAIGFSGKGVIIKLAYRYGVDPATLIMYRMLFALPFFVLMGLWAERRPQARALELNRRDMLGIAGLGFLGYYFSSYLDFLGLQYVSAGLERLILYLNPTLVMLLGWVLYRKPITPMRALAMAVSYSGVLLVFSHEMSFAGSDVALGTVLVLLSALTYAAYLLYSGEIVKRIGSARLVGWATSVACVLCIVQFLIIRPLSAAVVPVEVLWLSLLCALVCTVAPVLMVMMAIERIGSSLAAQTGMVGPMSTLFLGVIFLGESLNVWIGVGTVLVLGGVYLFSKYGAN